MLQRILILLFAGAPLFATTYYVSNAGVDSNDGTSLRTAWKTCSKINNSGKIFQPGDSVLFERGGVWREGLNFNASGNASAWITVGAYGGGPLPVLNGSNLVAPWTAAPQTSFTAYSAPLSSRPASVFEDGQWLGYGPQTSAAALTPGSFFYDTANKTLFVRTFEDADPGSHLIEAAVRQSEVGMYGNYVIYRELHATKAAYAGFNMSAAFSNVTVDRCRADYSAMRGINFYDGKAIESNLTITNNVVAHNMLDGIKVSVQGSHYVIEGNYVHHNAFANHGNRYTGGIYIATANNSFPRETNVIDRFNIVHHNGPIDNPKECGTCGNGIWHDTIGVGSVIAGNVTWGNTAAGVDLEYTGKDGHQPIVGNVTFNNSQFGIYVTRQSWGVVIGGNTSFGNLHNIQIIGECGGDPIGMKNNIVSGNTTWGGRANEFVATCGGGNEDGKSDGNTFSNNNFGTPHSKFVYFGKSDFSTYADWMAAAGKWVSGQADYGDVPAAATTK